MRDIYPEIIPPEGRAPKIRVGFFSGCYTDFSDPAIGKASIKVLHAHGCEVIFPKAQTCCAMPVFASGDWNTALDLAEINRNAFEWAAVDAVITACATCGTALKQFYQEMADSLEPRRRGPLLRFSKKVFDISEFLIDRIAFQRPERAIEGHMTYHDSCHLLRTQNVVSQPREIFGSITNSDIVEMSEIGQCCGGGGAFSIDHPELSEKIGMRKIDQIKKSGAQIVATGCPGCLFQIGSLVRKRQLPIRTLHTMQALADLYA